jgi:hypothetical protein
MKRLRRERTWRPSKMGVWTVEPGPASTRACLKASWLPLSRVTRKRVPIQAPWAPWGEVAGDLGAGGDAAGGDDGDGGELEGLRQEHAGADEAAVAAALGALDDDGVGAVVDDLLRGAGGADDAHDRRAVLLGEFDDLDGGAESADDRLDPEVEGDLELLHVVVAADGLIRDVVADLDAACGELVAEGPDGFGEGVGEDDVVESGGGAVGEAEVDAEGLVAEGAELPDLRFEFVDRDVDAAEAAECAGVGGCGGEVGVGDEAHACLEDGDLDVEEVAEGCVEGCHVLTSPSR